MKEIIKRIIIASQGASFLGSLLVGIVITILNNGTFFQFLMLYLGIVVVVSLIYVNFVAILIVFPLRLLIGRDISPWKTVWFSGLAGGGLYSIGTFLSIQAVQRKEFDNSSYNLQSILLLNPYGILFIIGLLYGGIFGLFYSLPLFNRTTDLR